MKYKTYLFSFLTIVNMKITLEKVKAHNINLHKVWYLPGFSMMMVIFTNLNT